MDKFIKTMLSLALMTVMIGGALLIVGLCMGGKPGGIRLYWNRGLRMETTKAESRLISTSATETPQTPGAGRIDATASATMTGFDGYTGEIDALDLEVGGATVEIVEGDGFHLAVEGTQSYRQEIEKGEWKIRCDAPAVAADVRLTLTIPRGFTFDKIALDVGAGKLTGKGLTCKRLSVEVGAGAVSLQNVTATQESKLEIGIGALDVQGALGGKVSIDCSLGRAALAVTRPADYGYRISSGAGSVKVDKNAYSGLGMDATHNTNADTVYEIDCGMGNVEVQFAA